MSVTVSVRHTSCIQGVVCTKQYYNNKMKTKRLLRNFLFRFHTPEKWAPYIFLNWYPNKFVNDIANGPEFLEQSLKPFS